MAKIDKYAGPMGIIGATLFLRGTVTILTVALFAIAYSHCTIDLSCQSYVYLLPTAVTLLGLMMVFISRSTLKKLAKHRAENPYFDESILGMIDNLGIFDSKTKSFRYCNIAFTQSYLLVAFPKDTYKFNRATYATTTPMWDYKGMRKYMSEEAEKMRSSTVNDILTSNITNFLIGKSKISSIQFIEASVLKVLTPGNEYLFRFITDRGVLTKPAQEVLEEYITTVKSIMKNKVTVIGGLAVAF